MFEFWQSQSEAVLSTLWKLSNITKRLLHHKSFKKVEVGVHRNHKHYKQGLFNCLIHTNTFQPLLCSCVLHTYFFWSRARNFLSERIIPYPLAIGYCTTKSTNIHSFNLHTDQYCVFSWIRWTSSAAAKLREVTVWSESGLLLNRVTTV